MSRARIGAHRCNGHRDRRGGSGFTAIEILVVALILAVLIALAMPSLSGYRATSALRTAARQFASDLRAAQENAIDQSTQVSVVFTTSGAAVTGYTVQEDATVLYQVALPSQVHATSSWPGSTVTFTAAGSVVGPGSTPALCLDNQSGVTIAAGITLATGRVQLIPGTGGC